MYCSPPSSRLFCKAFASVLQLRLQFLHDLVFAKFRCLQFLQSQFACCHAYWVAGQANVCVSVVVTVCVRDNAQPATPLFIYPDHQNVWTEVHNVHNVHQVHALIHQNGGVKPAGQVPSQKIKAHCNSEPLWAYPVLITMLVGGVLQPSDCLSNKDSACSVWQWVLPAGS